MSNGKPKETRPRSLRAKMAPAQVDIGFQWGVLNSALLGIGVVVLVAGYVILARGSLTLAPILLVTGYCVLVPASLLVRGRTSEPGE